MTLTLQQRREELAALHLHDLTPTNVIAVANINGTASLVFDNSELEGELELAESELERASKAAVSAEATAAELTQRILKIRETSMNLSRPVS